MKYHSMVFLIAGSWGLAWEDTPKKPWSNAAELSAVRTGGNAESSTIGFKNDYEYRFDQSLLSWKTGAIRVENTRTTRFAEGTPDSFRVIEDKRTETSDEKYHMDLKFEHEIRERFFWFTGFHWERNEFAGIRNRYESAAGVGNVWLDKERTKLKSDYGLQYTVEENGFEPADFDGSYASVKLTYSLMRKIGANTEFSQSFSLVENLEESSDFRVDLDNSLSASLTKSLAIKVGLQFLYDNRPALRQIPLIQDEAVVGRVLFELDELDTVFTTSLVINF